MSAASQSPVSRRQFHRCIGAAALGPHASGWPLTSSRALANERSSSRGCPLVPSVLVYHKPHHDNAVEQIARVVELGFHRVHVVVALACRIERNGDVLGYGFVEGGEFEPLDEPRLATFRDHLEQLFAAVDAARLELAVTAHLNSWGPRSDWRNHLDFDPLKVYANYAYDEAMIESIVACHHRGRANRPVELALVGEMGRTVFAYPDAYTRLLERLRRDPRSRNWQLGVSLNFSEVSGGLTPSTAERERVDHLFSVSDFLGFSNYRPPNLPIDRSDFVDAVEEFLSQLDHDGPTAHRRLPLVMSEVGMGGCRENNVPAENPTAAAETPWQGTVFARRNPWQPGPMQEFRREFHAALLEFLADPPAGTTMQGAYVWSEGSWDPLDVVDRGFFDAEIAAMIGRHNRAVAP